ncbi:ADP compounds hydrolase NudE [Limihaloglobus sulfuriphilus]|uniref:ADP compounds hydrolase NudE n=1 Tax=Limihaloglobus sulfuriphilus TaxID=1851148 RepID=A0A1Q2MBU4_9BACT|nr:NUDIX hydrolase [Limihaloglobus sulfuriphilus]AQQ70130.1 ADP compounds hydrolase NudE [Limihaloglobus sulfuriphilus]
MEYKIEKLTDSKWLNLYEIEYKHNNRSGKWLMSSRKETPIEKAAAPDAVVIIPLIDTPRGRRLVITKEFRVPIGGYEYGFPAGLIDPGESVEDAAGRELKEETGLMLKCVKHTSKPVFSSSGMTDESCIMAIVEAEGEVSNKYLKGNEDIETLLMSVEDLSALLQSDKFVAAKAWGILYHFAISNTLELA